MENFILKLKLSEINSNGSKKMEKYRNEKRYLRIYKINLKKQKKRWMIIDLEKKFKKKWKKLIPKKNEYSKFLYSLRIY